MSQRKNQQATYADIEALPPHVTGEILFGVLHTQPRPAVPHALAQSGLHATLGNPFHFGKGGPGGWVILVEPELRLGPHVVVPDIAGWRVERVAGNLDGAAIEIAPDWVCEVMSPSTEVKDKRDKMRIYANYQVPFLWHLEPVRRILEVFKREQQNWLLIHTFVGDENVTAQPFDAITFKLNELWPFPPTESK